MVSFSDFQMRGPGSCSCHCFFPLSFTRLGYLEILVFKKFSKCQGSCFCCLETCFASRSQGRETGWFQSWILTCLKEWKLSRLMWEEMERSLTSAAGLERVPDKIPLGPLPWNNLACQQASLPATFQLGKVDF